MILTFRFGSGRVMRRTNSRDHQREIPVAHPAGNQVTLKTRTKNPIWRLTARAYPNRGIDTELIN